MNCESCQYWQKSGLLLDEKGSVSVKGEESGLCRFNPPIPTPSVGGGYRSYPITKKSDWCGQFVPRGIPKKRGRPPKAS